MILTSLLFTTITALWWALVWFVLPLDLRHLSIPALVSLHVLVPVGLMAFISFFRRWRARVAQARALAVQAQEAQAQQQRIDAAREAHAAQLAERRVAMQCRGAWVSALTQADPAVELEPATLLAVADRPRGGWADTLSPQLADVFSRALTQLPAAAWLPIYVFPNAQRDGLDQLDLVRKTWLAAAQSLPEGSAPAQADCKFLPGSTALVDRVLAVLANDPGLPGCLVLGFDALTEVLDQADELGDLPDEAVQKQWAWQGQPGGAAALLLFTRAGLRASDAPVEAGASADVYTPYWEQNRGTEAGQLSWGRVPPHLQRAVIDARPLALLAAGGNVINPQPKGNALTRQVQGAFEAALINAGLRDQPFDSGSAEPAPVAAGWLVHNSGNVSVAGARLSGLSLALNYFGCELNVVDEADNLVITFGDMGAAREPLGLAVAALRVAQTKAPVVVAQFDGTVAFSINVLTPASEETV